MNILERPVKPKSDEELLARAAMDQKQSLWSRALDMVRHRKAKSIVEQMNSRRTAKNPMSQMRCRDYGAKRKLRNKRAKLARRHNRPNR